MRERDVRNALELCDVIVNSMRLIERDLSGPCMETLVGDSAFEAACHAHALAHQSISSLQRCLTRLAAAVIIEGRTRAHLLENKLQGRNENEQSDAA